MFLESDTLDIAVGIEQGLLDGGHIRRINIQMIPQHLRMPNTKLLIYIDKGKITRIEAFK